MIIFAENRLELTTTFPGPVNKTTLVVAPPQTLPV